MNKKLSKILTIVAGVIGFVGFFFFIRIVMEGDDALETDLGLQNSIISPFVSFAKYLLILVTGIAVVFSVRNLFKEPEALKRTLLGVGVLAVILLGSYLFASDAEVTDTMGKVLKDGEAGSISKWVSTLINYSFVLGTIGLLFFVVDFVKSLVK